MLDQGHHEERVTTRAPIDLMRQRGRQRIRRHASVQIFCDRGFVDANCERDLIDCNLGPYFLQELIFAGEPAGARDQIMKRCVAFAAQRLSPLISVSSCSRRQARANHSRAILNECIGWKFEHTLQACGGA